MDKLAKMLTDNPTVEIEISGHTDSKGDDNYNQKLSEARAQSVVNYLISKGIDKDRLSAIGYGETMPVAPNKNDDGSDNPEGREKNRRTEYKVTKK
jgi:outer membrane protein OmpA-like peptidoglycan-associated protein